MFEVEETNWRHAHFELTGDFDKTIHIQDEFHFIKDANIFDNVNEDPKSFLCKFYVDNSLSIFHSLFLGSTNNFLAEPITSALNKKIMI